MAVVVLPAQSLTVQVRIIVPKPQASKPELSSVGKPVVVTLASQLSEAARAVPAGIASQSTVISAGTVSSIVGETVSSTVML